MKKTIKKQAMWRYGFAIILILVGAILTYVNVGEEFLGFDSVGLWLVYVGFVMLAIITLQIVFNRKRIVDERMQFIAMKSAKITFLVLILSAFFIMILDGIKPITVPYSYFMSYLISGVILVYFVSYKILVRYN